MKRAFEVIVKGNVQKTAFRPFIRQLAKKCRLFGSVENLNNYDEDVRIVCEGEERNLQKFLSRLRTPTKEDREETSAIISRIKVKSIPLSWKFDNFVIIRKVDEVAERLDEGLIIMGRGFKRLENVLGGKTDSLKKETSHNFNKLGSKISCNFSKLDNSISNNFNKLDGKYGSVSHTLKSISGSIKQNNKLLARIAGRF